MTFVLNSNLEDLIRRKVASGLYESPAQVIEEALQLLDERDTLRALRRERLVREIAGGALAADNRQLIDSAEVFQGLANKSGASEQ